MYSQQYSVLNPNRGELYVRAVLNEILNDVFCPLSNRTIFNNIIFKHDRIFIENQDALSDAQELAKGADPRNKDTDGDGLWDGWKDELKLDPLDNQWKRNGKYDSDETPGEIGDPSQGVVPGKNYFKGSIQDVCNVPDSEKPNPLKKDIYVEEDWMAKSDGTCSHKMLPTARDSVIGAFSTHGIALHIDDGDTTKGWKGGTAITHTDTTTTNDWNGESCWNTVVKAYLNYVWFDLNHDGNRETSSNYATILNAYVPLTGPDYNVGQYMQVK